MSSSVHPLSQSTETAPPVEDFRYKKRFEAKYSLRMKIIIFALVTAFVPLAILAYVSYVTMQNIMADMIDQTLSTDLLAATTDVEEFIKIQQNAMHESAEDRAIIIYFGDSKDSEIEDDAQGVLQQLQNVYGGLSYALLDTQGKNVLSTISSEIGQDESKAEYFQVPVQDGQTHITVLVEPDGVQSYFYVSSPVTDDAGEVVGVLRAQYDAGVLQQLIEQLHLDNSNQSFVMLLDEYGVQLANDAQPNNRFTLVLPLTTDQVQTLQAGRRIPQVSMSELMLSEMPGLEEGLNNLEGDSYFNLQLNRVSSKTGVAMARQLNAYPWYIVVVESRSAMIDAFGENIFLVGVAALILALITIFVVLNISRRLAEPLVRLSDVSQQVSHGAFGLRVPVETQDEIGVVADAFNNLTAQIRQQQETVDDYIAERTQALGGIVRSLETSTKIGRQITTILKIDDLLRHVVNRIQIEFNFYYTQIYLVEEDTHDLVLAEGSGEIGRQLKARGHRLAAGEGIVGAVAGSNEFFLSNDVSKVINFVSNDLLSETHAELALPLRKGDRVLGVLDIQSRRTNRFTSADVSLMQSIANQTAIAIENARLLAETQVALQEVERLNKRLTREGWDTFDEEISAVGYHFSEGHSQPLISGAGMLPMIKKTALQRQTAKQGGNGDASESELAIPLKLRGEVIGVLGVKRGETNGWNEEEVTAVEEVATQLTLALENARLSHEQAKTIVQLKEVDRLKSEFLTSMSHELRTPLNSIIGFADVILQGIDGDVSDMAFNDVQLIHNSGQHLLALINGVLDLAKIEAGKMELDRGPLDVQEIVADVIAGSNALVQSKPVEIVTDIEDDLPAVYVDKLRFNQILLNLVSNAAKFTDEGNITIKANTWEEDDHFALISIIDQGIGIPAYMLDTIFDRFRQVDGTATRKVGGTGLGLAICKELVEMHGGFINVTSQEGEGSNFHFTIPFVEQVIEQN